MNDGLRRTGTIFFLLAVATRAPVFANDLSGTLKDLCGRVLPGATVSLAGEASSMRQVKSDALGAYSFHAVAAGSSLGSLIHVRHYVSPTRLNRSCSRHPRTCFLARPAVHVGLSRPCHSAGCAAAIHPRSSRVRVALRQSHHFARGQGGLCVAPSGSGNDHPANDPFRHARRPVSHGLWALR